MCFFYFIFHLINMDIKKYYNENKIFVWILSILILIGIILLIVFLTIPKNNTSIVNITPKPPTSDYPETPETPETSGTPETPETSGTPETPETSGTPETPETSETPEEEYDSNWLNPFELCYQRRGCILDDNNTNTDYCYGLSLGDDWEDMLERIQKEYEEKPNEFNNNTIHSIYEEYDAEENMAKLLYSLSENPISCWEFDKLNEKPGMWKDTKNLCMDPNAECINDFYYIGKIFANTYMLIKVSISNFPLCVKLKLKLNDQDNYELFYFDSEKSYYQNKNNTIPLTRTNPFNPDDYDRVIITELYPPKQSDYFVEVNGNEILNPDEIDEILNEDLQMFF